ncbi:MAG: amidohydrolase, partial [Gemmatimonadaceae bacterium]|nr:amidohydrolase [Gemmatimonadaceae bacterium]
MCALDPPSPPADTFPIEARRERVALILRNARVYSLQWGEPRFDGTPSPSAPYDQGRWRPDAGAIAIGDRRIIAVGSDSAILALREAGTVVRDLRGATVLPGLVDAHTHVAELGASLARVDLVGVRSTAEAMARVAAAARGARPGAWILGQGWDEGAWADTVLTARALSARFPRNPVYLRGLHGFSGWANRAALARAGITRETPDPTGGVIDRDADGTPAGRVRNRAVKLLDDAIPPPTLAEAESHWLLGLRALARAGYTTIHEAGVDRVHLAALRSLASQCRLPIRVYAMVSTRDSAAVREWLARGPDTSGAGGVTVRAAKAYYDGALGSRGARLFADYADLPGHLGVAGAAYGFDSAAVAAMMRRGFQVGIHAIGDAGNDEVLDFLARVQATVERPALRRDRIEHAQVMARSTTHRVRDAGVIPSMQPVHAVEDAPWVVARIGAERATGAYAWRALRRVGLAPAFGSDLPGSGFGIGYGLHAATTRTDTLGAPPGGWYPDQRLTIEEAVRGFTIWAQRAAFVETRRGMIAPGYDADLTVLDADPFDPATRLP